MLLTYDAGEIEEQDGETASHGDKTLRKKTKGKWNGKGTDGIEASIKCVGLMIVVR